MYNKCSDLKEVKFSDSLRIIGDNIFNGCLSLESIRIPTSLESVGNNTFSHFFNGSQDLAKGTFHSYFNALCNTSSIQSTYPSNHDLTSIWQTIDGWGDWCCSEQRRMFHMLELNRIAYKHLVAVQKIIR